MELADLIDLEIQLYRDQSTDRKTLQERDRNIGRSLRETASDRTELIKGWLEEIRHQSDLPGHQATSLLNMLQFLLILFGLATGYAAASGCLNAFGTQPVNVVYFLGLLVGGQILLFVLWTFSILPGVIFRYLPFIGDLQNTLRIGQPARLLVKLGNLFSGRFRQYLQSAFGRLKSFGNVYGSVQFWKLVTMSQYFALFFNVGALSGTLLMVTFTDLSFSWRTTLQVDATHFHQLIEWLAIPWVRVFPEAVPSLELVQSTRFDTFTQQFQDGPLPPERSGEWWLFLVTSLTVYGFGLRLLATAFSEWRLYRCLDQIDLTHTKIQRLIDRLSTPRYGVQASPASEAGPDQTTVAEQPSFQVSEDVLLVDWARVPLQEETKNNLVERTFGAEVRRRFEAGGPDPEEDQHTLRTMNQMELPDATVVIVKAWESPTRDFRSFLSELRETMGEKLPITVLPVDVDGTSVQVPNKQDHRKWKLVLQEEGDPWLRVDTPEPLSKKEAGT